MSLNQDEVLKKFREEIFAEGIVREGDSVGTDDETLRRFLRARKFDLKAAKKMIKDCQKWRQSVEGVGIDELYKQIDPFDYPGREAVFNSWPLTFHKTDKKGRPINIHFFGDMNLPEMYKSITPKEHWRSIIVNAECLPREILPAAAREAGRPIGSVLVIVDLKGFGVSQFWQMKALARQSFQISQDYFPETMGKLAIVNAPASFTAIWSVLKRWMSKDTIEKVDILGSNYKDVLLGLVDEENLPSILGGKCTCEHEEGGSCYKSGVGPWKAGRVGWGPKSQQADGTHVANGTPVLNGTSVANGTPLVNGNQSVNGSHMANGTHLVNGSEKQAGPEVMRQETNHGTAEISV